VLCAGCSFSIQEWKFRLKGRVKEVISAEEAGWGPMLCIYPFLDLFLSLDLDHSPALVFQSSL